MPLGFSDVLIQCHIRAQRLRTWVSVSTQRSRSCSSARFHNGPGTANRLAASSACARQLSRLNTSVAKDLS